MLNVLLRNLSVVSSPLDSCAMSRLVEGLRIYDACVVARGIVTNLTNSQTGWTTTAAYARHSCAHGVAYGA
jgi:hypothetical protein